MSTVKNFSFTIIRRPRAGAMYYVAAAFTTPSRTLAEAQADLRHYLRRHFPDILDNLGDFAYTCDVSHV